MPDLIAPGLKVLFVGINPGLYSAAVGHHFARPGNRFWPALHAAGFTRRRLAPFEERELLARGYGITNIVARASAAAAELSAAELMRGARRLTAKVRRLRPRIVVVLGVQAYRLAFHCPQARLGEQPRRIGAACVWVLPSPSGRTAGYRLAELARELRRVRLAANASRVSSAP